MRYGPYNHGGNSGNSGKSGNTVRNMGFAWCDKGVLARFGDSDGRCAKNGPHAYTRLKRTIAYSGVMQNLTAGSMLYTHYIG